MGSFYVNCSITNKTIADGDEMVIQFMVPSWIADYKTPSGKAEMTNLSMSIFLNTIKLEGFDKAMAKYADAYQDMVKEEEEFGKDVAPKGVVVSNDGALHQWVPVGPAIRGTYDDCGHIEPSTDPENLERIETLRKIFYDVPFESIMGAATDDRWLTYGFREGDTHWKVEGLDENLPKEALNFFKKLSVTYFHASVYDTVKKFDFCADEGTMKSKYSKKWKKEYLERNKKLVPALKKRKKINVLGRMTMRESLENFSFYRVMNRKNGEEYLNRLTLIAARDFTWLLESLSFCYGLSGLCIELKQSQYGSQERNWKGWERIEGAINSTLAEIRKKQIEDWGDDEEREEDPEIKTLFPF